MEELTSVVLSGIAWDAIKKGIKISANYLKRYCLIGFWMMKNGKRLVSIWAIFPMHIVFQRVWLRNT